MSNACRHFRPRDLILKNGGCAIGHNLQKIIEAKTDAPMFGALKDLCCRGNGTKILDCPDADFKSDEEVAASRAELQQAMNRTITALPKLLVAKSDMILKGEEHRRIDCPFCGAEQTVEAFVNIRDNKHMHARCSSCGDGIME